MLTSRRFSAFLGLRTSAYRTDNARPCQQAKQKRGGGNIMTRLLAGLGAPHSQESKGHSNSGFFPRRRELPVVVPLPPRAAVRISRWP